MCTAARTKKGQPTIHELSVYPFRGPPLLPCCLSDICTQTDRTHPFFTKIKRVRPIPLSAKTSTTKNSSECSDEKLLIVPFSANSRHQATPLYRFWAYDSTAGRDMQEQFLRPAILARSCSGMPKAAIASSFIFLI